MSPLFAKARKRHIPRTTVSRSRIKKTRQTHLNHFKTKSKVHSRRFSSLKDVSSPDDMPRDLDAMMASYDPNYLGDEFDAVPEEKKNEKLVANLHTFLNETAQGNKLFSLSSLGESVSGGDKFMNVPNSHDWTLQQQQREDFISKQVMAQTSNREFERLLDREIATLTATEAELEMVKQTRTVLKPIRSMIPTHIQKFMSTLINEAKVRNLDETGLRDFSSPPTAIPGHDSDSMVYFNGRNIALREIEDRELVTEITKLTITWNRSGARNTPLPMDEEFDLQNKAKLEKGVSGYFSANKETGGRQFTYDQFLSEAKEEHDLDVAHFEAHKQKTGDTDSTQKDVAISSPKPQKVVKSSSPFQQLTMEKPHIPVLDKLPSSAEEINTHIVHHDFLHNSALRRKPSGKLSDVQLRDLLVDVSRFHPIEDVLEHYNISMLSLFEEPRAQQAVSHAANVIGGFSPLHLHVTANFDDNFIKTIDILHKQSMQMKAKKQLEQQQQKNTIVGSSEPTTHNIESSSNPTIDTLEEQYLSFMKRLTSSKDGKITLNKDDILIPDFPDSMLELLLSESLSVSAKHRTVDESQIAMREMMIKELIILKGRTIGELHQLGIFNQSPYDINQSSFDASSNGKGSSGVGETQQRNKYAFNDEMKHMHRVSHIEQIEEANQSLFGGSRGEEMRRNYSNRAQTKFSSDATPNADELKGGDAKRKKYEKALYKGVDLSSNESRSNVGGRYMKLDGISRFAQRAVAASAISKYGSLADDYRSAVGVTMDTIDDMIADALHEGGIEVNTLPKEQRKEYLDQLKQEALEFPLDALKCIIDQISVPYMTIGQFRKLPTRFLGVKSFDLAHDSAKLNAMGILNEEMTPLGPYHPLFVVAVGGKGYQAESEWKVESLRAMLGGDIDVKRREQRAEKNTFQIHAPGGLTLNKFEEIRDLSKIPEVGLDDNGNEGNVCHNMDDKTIKLNDDPSEIKFNTSSMTEFHHVNIVNEQDITERTRTLIEGGFKSVEEFKKKELSHDSTFDPSVEWTLKHFVKTVQEKNNNNTQPSTAALDNGDGQNINKQALLSADQLNDPIFYANNPQQVFDEFDIKQYSPDEFHSKRMEMLQSVASQNLKENELVPKSNQFHELYGGPVTVDQYIGRIVETDKGKEISQAVVQDHKSWLSDLIRSKK